ncbi:GDSL ESTERASE/LIPASE EXL3 [Salix viminalis]|uniref:GDSL ESTERASE/LIPASE EXL3 n=1 Tax=Salix viminalis TaxID=40686 RepID=A0A9Q0ZJ06_SALVM|nr:GDSL ESTERASE/LIPASE EXL3 [Salix viminalis]
MSLCFLVLNLALLSRALFSANELGIKETLPAYLDPTVLPQDLITGVSFASGGSGFDPLTPKLVSVLTLSDQLEYFKEYIGKLKAIIGEENTTFTITNTSSFVQELYKLGARRIGVFSAPPVGCVPAQRTLAGGVERECAQNLNEAAKLFNSKLSKKLDSLASSLPSGRFVYMDIYNPFLDLIQNPRKYGK